MQQYWLLGGDFNASTCESQPPWGPRDHLDHNSDDIHLPARTSDDKRAISTHGKRLLHALSDFGMLLNGIVSHVFSGAFTRMPTRDADCPGVIDYVCGPPSVLPMIPHGGFNILDSPPDISDHHPAALTINIDAAVPTETEHLHFQQERFRALKIPTDPSAWATIEHDVTCRLQRRVSI